MCPPRPVPPCQPDPVPPLCPPVPVPPVYPPISPCPPPYDNQCDTFGHVYASKAQFINSGERIIFDSSVALNNLKLIGGGSTLKLFAKESGFYYINYRVLVDTSLEETYACIAIDVNNQMAYGTKYGELIPKGNKLYLTGSAILRLPPNAEIAVINAGPSIIRTNCSCHDCKAISASLQIMRVGDCC